MRVSDPSLILRNDRTIGGTRIVNVVPYRLLEIE